MPLLPDSDDDDALARVASGLLRLVVCVVLASGTGFAQERAAGFVKVLAGGASAERQGQSRSLTPGDPIFESDTLRTGADGHLGVTLKDETRLSLGPNTSVVLTSFTYAPAEQRFALVVRVARGLLEYISGRLGKLAPESVRIETPSSIVGIRGTRVLIGAAQ